MPGVNTQYTDEQIAYLKEEFERDQYPDERRRKIIAIEISLTKDQVKKWFLNERKKLQAKARRAKARDRRARLMQNWNWDQIEILEKAFKRNHYPDNLKLMRLASKMKVKVGQIQGWFSRRRGASKEDQPNQRRDVPALGELAASVASSSGVRYFNNTSTHSLVPRPMSIFDNHSGQLPTNYFNRWVISSNRSQETADLSNNWRRDLALFSPPLPRSGSSSTIQNQPISPFPRPRSMDWTQGLELFMTPSVNSVPDSTPHSSQR